MTVRHADFAIPVAQHMTVTTTVGVSGRVIALGWWTDPDSANNPEHEPTGTLYLVVDPEHPRPQWIAEGSIETTTLDAPQ